MRAFTATLIPLFLCALAHAQFGGGVGRVGDPGITHGPILGRPGATEIAVWVRTSRPDTFVVQYGVRGSEMKTTSEPVVTRLENDNTGWVLLKGLKPNSQYSYRVVRSSGSADPGGRRRLLPHVALGRKSTVMPAHNPRGLFNLKFEVGSCANQGEHSLGPSLPAYKTMLDQQADKRALRHHERRLAVRGQARLLAGCLAQAGGRTRARHAARGPAGPVHHRRLGELQERT